MENWPTAIIGTFESQSRSFTVFILTMEDVQTPHLHIGDFATFPECKHFHCMVSLLTPKYYGIYKEMLDPTQLSGFIEFISSLDEDGDSIWRYTLKTWNMNNSESKIPMGTPIPDYEELGLKNNH